jgi:DNA-directed RNA polymerase specialized sigma24 family protein
VEVSGLTPESLEALLAFLDPEDRDRAGTRYETIRRRLVRLFEWRGFGNAEDLADETMDRVARRIHEGVTPTSDPYAYFCGVAQFLSKEVARRAARERAALEQDALLSAPPEEEEDDDDRRVCLRLCLERLPHDQRLLVLRYHQEDDHIRSRQMLSWELGVPMNALRIRVHRIRRKLEDCVQACLSRGREAQSPVKRISRFRHP